MCVCVSKRERERERHEMKVEWESNVHVLCLDKKNEKSLISYCFADRKKIKRGV